VALPRLLALDLDGTLLGPGDRIAPEDHQAIGRALRAGITVTIATGRITTGALPTAQALGLRGPMVVADGAVLADAVDGTALSQHSLHEGVVTDLTHAMGGHALQPFWFLHDEIHGEHGSDAVAGYVRTWSPRLSLHAALQHSAAWERRHEVAIAIGVGLQAGVERTAEWLDQLHGARVNVATFPLDREQRWAMMVRDRASDKAQGLARLCAREGLEASQVAVVGDWINDVPMFKWAGRSFAMGHSPDDVAKHATERLTKTAKGVGGGVAEAIGRLLG
jgi:hydroxymethylpyrimidine pyrophosphatase-like HAD family hydrolase